MYYAPHNLYKQVSLAIRNDYGEIVSEAKEWVYIGKCRCDDNTTSHFETPNGGVYIPKYHIVSDKCQISEGDTIKVENTDGSYRGGGKVYNAPKCNYLNYMSIYV